MVFINYLSKYCYTPPHAETRFIIKLLHEEAAGHMALMTIWSIEHLIRHQLVTNFVNDLLTICC